MGAKVYPSAGKEWVHFRNYNTIRDVGTVPQSALHTVWSRSPHAHQHNSASITPPWMLPLDERLHSDETGIAHPILCN